VGSKSISKTFRTTKVAAKSWVTSTEDEIERCEIKLPIITVDMTVVNLLDDFERKVTERKKGYHASEKYTLERLRVNFARVGLITLSPERVVDFSDMHLKTVKANTVQHEIAVLSAAWETAKVLWKYSLQGNPIHICCENVG